MKIRISLTCEESLIKEAQKRGLNLNEILEGAIARLLYKVL